MRQICILVVALIWILAPAGGQSTASTYLGFDRNEYPGDASLKELRRTFSFAGYWLNNAPGASANTWAGHREAVEAAGLGFLVLFNGRLYAELKSEEKAVALGRTDARSAAASAQHEGFPRGTVIFLDQEQGGRMLPEQRAYIHAWVDGVVAAGFRAGIYCSGMAAPDVSRAVTAADIRGAAGSREIAYWVANDSCPPSPGCTFPQQPPQPWRSGVRFAEVWQFAQSPRRGDVAAHCTNYNFDGNCYPPAVQGMHVDLNTAISPDPSRGRSR